MKQSSQSREKLISEARNFIIERGFSAMSVSDVCSAAGVTKGSFFHHFVSKESLGEAVLDEFWQNVQHRQELAEFKKLADPIAKVRGYVDHAIEIYQDPMARSGCLLAIYTAELKETHPKLFSKCVPYFHAWKEDLQSLIEEASNQLPANVSFNSQSWAELYISTLEGALILAKALDDPQIISRTLALYRNQLISNLSA